MKSLLLVLLITNISVNGFHNPDVPEGFNSADEVLQWEERNQIKTTVDPDQLNTPFDMQGSRVLYFEDGEGHNEIKLRSSSNMLLETLSNAISIQVMALKTMKENQENTMRNLSNTILTQDRVLQIMKQDISNAISDQGMDLQIMQSNLTDTISNGGMDFQINQDQIMSNLSDGFSNQKNMIEIMEDNQDIIKQNLTHLGCPESFFRLSPSNQCFKYFNDQKRTWFEANSMCQSEGLVMAKPSDPLILRKYLVNKYGNYPSKGWPYVWVSARGTGSYFYWQPNGGRIEGTNPYWMSTPSGSSLSSSNCMYMVNYAPYMSGTYATKPFSWTTCTSQSYYTICELVKE